MCTVVDVVHHGVLMLVPRYVLQLTPVRRVGMYPEDFRFADIDSYIVHLPLLYIA